MRLVIQRVSEAAVVIDGRERRSIGKGLVVLFGAKNGDERELCSLLARKTRELRIFEDENGKMNLSAEELSLEIMVIPNVTLFADTKKGRRPSFIDAAPPDAANDLYMEYIARLRDGGLAVTGGVFRSDMKVSLTNDGPVTIIMDTEEWK